MKQNQQNDKPKPRKITLKQFLRYFEEQRNRKFCFILGAGASKNSGIPTGAELASQWLPEIEEDLDKDQFESWLREESIDKDDLASFYPQIFAKRFEVDHQGGYDFFEKIMEDAEPSCGYSFLAEILAKGDHDIVITTNFDSLTEDALFIYTAKKPLVIGHADLADFIKIQLQRPMVIKVHHDVFLSPQNTADEIKDIDKKLKRGLQDIFQSYIPIVIGYGGNDGGFMDVLKEALDPDRGIYWCFTGTEHPKGKIEELVIDKQGCFLPITDFDELMVLLGEKIGIGLLDEKIEQIAEERVKEYRKQMQGVYNKIKDGSDLLPNALEKIIKREKPEGPNWWFYGFQASIETDPKKKVSFYTEGLEKCPDSPELMNDYALFLMDIERDYTQAKKYYQKALKLDPDDAIINGNYALLLTRERDYTQAKEYHQKALELDPDDADINGNYALFLLQQGYFEQAKTFINKAFQHIQAYNKNLELELWFYRYACFYSDYPESKSKIESLLQDGIRLPGWPLEGLLETVKQIVQHPEYDQVAEFARQISEV